MSILELKKEPHWSYSALECFLTCPMKYKFRYAELFFPNENIINCAECPYAGRCKKATWKGD